MDLHAYLGLQPTADPLRWTLELNDRITTPQHFMNGGSGFAACMSAFEIVTGRPVVWASCHFESFVYAPAVLEIDLALHREGGTTSHGRAVLRNGDDTILSVDTALGRRADGFEGTWLTRPQAPDPRDCTRIDLKAAGPAERSIADHTDMRRAIGRSVDQFDGTPSDGHSALWIHMDTMSGPVTAGELAIVADFVPFDIGQPLGQNLTGSSIDNTLRMCELRHTDWVLLDIHMQAMHRNVMHATAGLWAEDGTLLGLASQTMFARPAGKMPPKAPDQPIESGPTP
jgi:acyl-CoA thioesterase